MTTPVVHDGAHSLLTVSTPTQRTQPATSRRREEPSRPLSRSGGLDPQERTLWRRATARAITCRRPLATTLRVMTSSLRTSSKRPF